MAVKLVIVGGAGRMGRRLVRLAAGSDDFEISAVVERSGHPDMGKDAGLVAGVGQTGVKLDSGYPDSAEVVVDFSQPTGVGASADYCVEKKASLVVGSTALDDGQVRRLKEAAEHVAVIYGSNMSVGMNVLFLLAGKVASMLGAEYDVEIIEQHHRFKKDAPSGSALTLARNICESTGREPDESLSFGRRGKEASRRQGEIGVHAVRAGDIAGIHSVMLSTLGETVTLRHDAHSRDAFARGALQAAKWLAGKKSGLYSMADCLGLKI